MENVNVTEYNGVKILYEDNHILVVVKPQNMPSQEDETKDTDLLTLMKSYLKEKYEKPGEAYLGLVHRLDRVTGGVMVFAKTSKAAARLSEAIREGEFEKTYLAVVYDTPKEKQGALVNYLKKDPTGNKVRVVPDTTEGAKYAELTYKVLESIGKLSLLGVRLATGRSHQIRVQLSHIGHPIVGDVRSGGNRPKAQCNLALWAAELRFRHPVKEQTMVFKVYPPEDEKPWNYFNLEPIFRISVKDAMAEND